MSPLEVLDVVHRFGERVAEIVNDASGPGGLAGSVAELLLQTWPKAALAGCLLTVAGQSHAAILDATGRLGDLEHQPEASSEEWGRRLSERGLQTCVSRIDTPAAVGFLILGLPSEAPEDPLASAFLRESGRTFSLLLSQASVRQELHGLQRLAHRGELAGPLAHEFANFLNVLLLQVAILEYQQPDHQQDFMEIRRQGKLALNVVNHFHDYRRGQSFSPTDLDLKRSLDEMVEEVGRDSFAEVSLRSAAPSKPVLVRGVPADMKHLLRFLLTNALRAAASGGKHVEVSVETTVDRISLCVEDDGSTPAPEDLQRLFEPSHPNRTGVDALELSASRSIARRLGASIRSEERKGGGVRFIVDFPVEKRV